MQALIKENRLKVKSRADQDNCCYLSAKSICAFEMSFGIHTKAIFYWQKHTLNDT